jgi:hypothetical protein
MTPNEFCAIPTVLGLSRAHLAKLLSRSPRCISHWTLGDRPLPYEVGILLQLLATQKITVRDVEEAAAPARANGNTAPDPEPAIADPEPEPEPEPRVPTVDSESVPPKSAVRAALPAVLSLTTAEKICALTPTACRWPCGDPQHPDFHFCSCPVTAGPYCATHRAQAYVTPSTGSDSQRPYLRRGRYPAAARVRPPLPLLLTVKGTHHAAAPVTLSVPPAGAPNRRASR